MISRGFSGWNFALPTTAIVARAVPLWTDEAGDGRFVWQAATD